MGRSPCCQKVGLKKGRWTAEEDRILIKHIQDNGGGSWRALPKNAGLLRCGKSCRLRWINYLRTDLKRGHITPQEEDLIIKLHTTIGNRWSLIATQLPGRTDNEIKNHWNSHLSRSINTWRRPANDTLPQHIIDNLAKLMVKPNPSTKKEIMKNAPTTIMEKGDNKPKTNEEIDDNNDKPKTPDALKAVPSNSWSTDQSIESIFSLEDHRDLVEGVDDYVDLLSSNAMVTPLMDHVIMPQSDHASNEFQNLEGAIDIEFMNDLANLGTNHAEMDTLITMDDNNTLKPSLSSSSYTFDPMIHMNIDWSDWEDYGEIQDQDLINHEEVGSFMMPLLWDCDDVGISGQ